jgi:hypothetical protein
VARIRIPQEQSSQPSSRVLALIYAGVPADHIGSLRQEFYAMGLLIGNNGPDEYAFHSEISPCPGIDYLA